ncbi:MAG: TolC family protein [Verrucomicrobia bacterium]|nr:TolC family protein [Verrucomicrobiota bacterium]
MLILNKSRFQFSILFGFLVLNIGQLFSEEDFLNQHSLQLDALVKEVLERNPDLEAAKERIRAAAEVIPRVQVIDDPEFKFTSDYNNFKSKSDWLPMLQYQISQTFPFPGKLGLKGKVAEEILKQFQSQETITRRDLILQSKSLYFQLVLNDLSFQINRNNRDVVENIVNASMSLYRSGIAGFEEVSKAQAELQILDEQLLAIDADRIFITSMLNAILNRAPNSPLGQPVQEFSHSLDFSYEELESIAIQNRPELEGLQAMVSEQEMMAKLAKRNYFPDVTISAGYEQMTNNLSDNAWVASIGFKIPLWAGRRQGREVREAKARASANISALKGMEANIRGQIQAILGKLKANDERILLYDTGLLPKIQETLKAAESSYRAGKGGFLVLLDTRRQFQEISLEYERVRIEKEVLLAELERAVGVPLEEIR